MKYLPVFLLLAACGGYGSSLPGTDHDIYIVAVVGQPYGTIGYTSWGPSGPATVQVSDDVMATNENLVNAILMHELVHACTRTSTHETDSSCYTYENGLPFPYVHPPCPEEITKMQMTTGTFTIHASVPWLLDNVAWAAAEWSAWAQRTMFVVNP